MAKEFGAGRNFTFLKLNAKGELYTGSKEPKEGFSEVTTKDGTIVYQKAYKSTDYGKVNFLTIAEKDFSTGKVKYVEMSILSEDETAIDVLQLPLKNLKGGLSDEVKKFIATLPSLDYSKTFIVSSNRDKNERGYVDKLLFFRYKGEGEEKDTPIKFSLKFGEEGNVPMFTVKEDPITPGSKVYNYDDQDRFLAGVLMYEIKRFQDFKEGNVYVSEYFRESTPNPETVVETAKKEPKAEKSSTAKENKSLTNALDEDDDSPF